MGGSNADQMDGTELLNSMMLVFQHIRDDEKQKMGEFFMGQEQFLTQKPNFYMSLLESEKEHVFKHGTGYIPRSLIKAIQLKLSLMEDQIDPLELRRMPSRFAQANEIYCPQFLAMLLRQNLAI